MNEIKEYLWNNKKQAGVFCIRFQKNKELDTAQYYWGCYNAYHQILVRFRRRFKVVAKNE